MKVLHVIEDLGLGGAEKLLMTLLPLLPSRGVEPAVMALGRRDDLAGPLRAAGVKVHQLALDYRRRPLEVASGVRRVLREESYHLVHTHLAHANLTGRVAAWWERIPVTSTYHDSDYEPEVLLDNPGMSRWKQKTYQTLDRVTAGACRRVIAVSSFVAQSLVRRLGFSAAQVEVIHNGLDGAAIAPVTPEDRRQSREALGLPLDGSIVVQVGRLTPQKGQLHTVRVAHLLKDLGILWVLVGDGPLRARLEAEVQGAGLQARVRFTGARPDVRSFLAAADLFLFPSLHEGLGIAALEAMAAGLPVVAYRTGPLTEVVVDGETGLLVPPGDTILLAEAVASLIRSRERSDAMGGQGRSRVRDHFLIDRTADRCAEFYHALLGPGR